jgi:hypothetical protein
MKLDSPDFVTAKFYLIILLGCFTCTSLISQRGVPLYLSEHTKISLLTSSPGRELYAQFGHSAIRIKDTMSGQDLVFNYGLFNFNTPGFYLKFIRGKLPYQLGIQRFDDFLNNYISENRQLRELDLNLTEKERLAFIDFLSVNYLPENREYAYDFFFDNCATRIRDILEKECKVSYPDTGLVKKETFRHFLAEYVGQNTWINVGFYLILGLPSDAKATFRDEMFLPDYLEKHLENASLKNNPLAKNKVRIIFQSQPIKNNPLKPGPILLGWILFFTGIFFSFYPGKRRIHFFDIIYFSVLSLAGFLFIFMWLGTDHTVTHKNMNIGWANPLYLLLLMSILTEKQQKILAAILFICNVCILLGWKFLPQEFHIAILPLILLNLLRLTDNFFTKKRRGSYPSAG